MQPNTEKEVYFDKYCNSCKYAEYEEDKDPCDECLKQPVNTYSHKPTQYEEKEDTHGRV